MSLGRERVALRAGAWVLSQGRCLGTISENLIPSLGLCYCCCEMREGRGGSVINVGACYLFRVICP